MKGHQILTLGCALALTTAEVEALDFAWVTAGSGDFQDSQNWIPGGYPNNNSDKAIFYLSNSYTVNFNDESLGIGTGITTNERAEITAGTVTFDLNNQDIPFVSTGKQEYVLSAASGTSLLISGAPGSLFAAKLILDSPFAFAAAGEVITSSTLNIGSQVNAGGILEIRNAGFSSTGTSLIGNLGNGTLDVQGQFESATIVLGFNTMATGVAHVSGALSSTSDLQVGAFGSGTLNIDGPGPGGYVSVANDMFVAIGNNATGTVNLTSGVLDVGGSVYVGGNSTSAGGNAAVNLDSTMHSSVGNDLVVWDGGSVDLNDGQLSVSDELDLKTNASFNFNDGHLSVGEIIGSSNEFSWSAGTLEITNSNFTIDSGNSLLGAVVAIAAGKNLIVNNTLGVGNSSSANLIVGNGSSVEAGNLNMVKTNAALGAPDLAVDSGGAVTVNSLLELASTTGLNGAGILLNPGAVLTTAQTRIGHILGTEGGVSANAAVWNNSGDLLVGGTAGTAAGSGSIVLDNGSSLDVGGDLTVWANSLVQTNNGSQLTVGNTLAIKSGGTVEINSGLTLIADLDVSGYLEINSGTVEMSASLIDVHSGGIIDGAIFGTDTTDTSVDGVGSSWFINSTINVGFGANSFGAMRSLQVSNGGFVEVSGDADFAAGSLTLGGGTVQANTIDIAGDLSGHGALLGATRIEGSFSATGDTSIGDSNNFNGVLVGGLLNVGGHHVTLNKKGFFLMSDNVVLTGGILQAGNGVSVAAGAGFSANGEVRGRVHAAGGSLIEANGNLVLGDNNSVAGYFSDGELAVESYTVELLDANQAVLGSLTTIGNSNEEGTLIAGNGLLVDFGRNITGRGLIDTPDDVLRPFINNGSVIGTSLAQALEINGYVKGVGHFDNVFFSGTVSSGFSPAIMNYGSASYAGELIVELGGSIPGAQHDQYNHSGTAIIDGVLNIVLIDDITAGYAPTLGDEFIIFTAASILGSFDDIVLPSLAEGLKWIYDNNGETISLNVAAVPVPAALWLMLSTLVTLGFCYRGRSQLTAI